MALIKCPECEKDVSSNADECVHCHCKLNNKISLEEKNIMVLLKYANVLRLICIFVGIITIIGGIVSYDFFGVIVGLLIILGGIVYPSIIENKAFILKNLYELNRKGK